MATLFSLLLGLPALAQTRTPSPAKPPPAPEKKATVPAPPDKKPETKTAKTDKKKAERPRPSVPLAPTKEELDQRRAAQRQAEEAREDDQRASRGRLPTQVGDTAGPGTKRGANSLQERKAATLEVSGPEDLHKR